MRPLIRSSLSVLALLVSTPAFAQTAPDPTGRWEGAIAMPEGDVKITIDLAKKSEGAWIGAVTIPGTTAADVPLDSFAINGTSVKFHAGLLESPTFTGTLSADGTSLTGDVANVRGAVPFQLKRIGAGKVNVPPPSAPFAQAKDVEGSWEGAIQVAERVVRLSLKIGPGPDGITSATLVNLGQGISVPITTVAYANKEMRLEARAITGSFVGKLGADGTIAGEWTQGPQKLPLTFKRAAS